MSSQHPSGILRIRPQDKWSWQMFLFTEARFTTEGLLDCSSEEPWFFPGVSPGEQGTVRRIEKDTNPDELRQRYGISADRRTRITGMRADPTLCDKAHGFAVLEPC